MSRILKVAAAVIAAALVVVGAVVVYRETDLLTGSLVVLCGLMIAALVARRAAAREERAGMAEWAEETLASERAAADLFGDWASATPGADLESLASPAPVVPEAADPSVAVSRPLRGEDQARVEQEASALFFTDDAPSAAPAPSIPAPTAPAPAPEPTVEPDPTAGPDPLGVDQFISAPDLAMAGAGSTPPTASAATGRHRSPIDWTGQGGRVDERVRSDDDIMRVSEATALTPAEGGSELARLLSKVEARLREYD